jgi:hypothetical protein
MVNRQCTRQTTRPCRCELHKPLDTLDILVDSVDILVDSVDILIDSVDILVDSVEKLLMNVGRGGSRVYGPPPRPRRLEFKAPPATGVSNTRYNN